MHFVLLSGCSYGLPDDLFKETYCLDRGKIFIFTSRKGSDDVSFTQTDPVAGIGMELSLGQHQKEEVLGT